MPCRMGAQNLGVGECGGRNLRGVGVQLANTEEPGGGWHRGSANMGPTGEGGDFRTANRHSNEVGCSGKDTQFGHHRFARMRGRASRSKDDGAILWVWPATPLSFSKRITCGQIAFPL
jgi:hypothetical protein